MIFVKSGREINAMRRAGAITGRALEAARAVIAPGVTTKQIDTAVHKAITGAGATPSFLHYRGFPASACISVNEQVIHGIPGPRALREGDIVSIDVGACIEGFHGDAAATFPVGKVSEEALHLIRVTRDCFYKGLEKARDGSRVSDISHAVQSYAEAHGFSVVRTFTGHGVGAALHEDPEVPNFGTPGRGPRLLPGMTVAIEPMINAGTHEVDVGRDGWTVTTADGRLSAHYEHTVLITGGAPERLTAWQEEDGNETV